MKEAFWDSLDYANDSSNSSVKPKKPSHVLGFLYVEVATKVIASDVPAIA